MKPAPRVPGGHGQAVPLTFAMLPATVTPDGAATMTPPDSPRQSVNPRRGAPNTTPLAVIFTTATACAASSTVASAPSRERIVSGLLTFTMHSQPAPTSAASSPLAGVN